MTPALALALALAGAPDPTPSPAPAEGEACWLMLDDADRRVAQLEAQVRDLRRRLAARTATTTAALTCSPTLTCPAPVACEPRSALLDVLSHVGAGATGLVLGRLACPGGLP